MESILKRFWFEFEIENNLNVPPGLVIGCGITAFNYEDAIRLVDEKIFISIKRPAFKRKIENVDIHELDQLHVVPNMKSIIDYGIWFPLGYE